MEASRRVTRSSTLEGETIFALKVKKNVKFDQPEPDPEPEPEGNESKGTEKFSGFDLYGEASIQDALFSPLTPSFLLKSRHPLAHPWTFWYSSGNKDLTWEQNQVRLCTVTSVEEFWFILKQVQPPSNIPAGYTYSVFRGDILPDWDHENNKEGGRWMASFPKSQRQEMLDMRWMEVLVMLMGDHVGQMGSKLITGAEVCVRKNGDRLEVWVANMEMMGIIEIGRLMRDKLQLDPKEKIQFSIHNEEVQSKSGSKLVM